MSVQEIKKSFLKKIGEWVAIRFPYLWRSKLLYFVFFSGVLLNSIIYFYVANTSLDVASMPLYNQIQLTIYFSWGIAFLVYLIWWYDQSRHPLREIGWNKLVYLIGCYALCILLLISNCLLAPYILLAKTANLLTEEDLQTKQTFLVDNRSTNRHLLKDEIIRFGILESNSSIFENNGKALVPYLNIYNRKLENIEFAQAFVANKKSIWDAYFDLRYYLVVILLLILFLLVGVFSKVVQKHIKFRPSFHFLTNIFKPLIKEENKLLLTHPYLWSTRAFLFIPIGCILVFSRYLNFRMREDNLELEFYFLGQNGTITIFTIIGAFTIYLFLWGFQILKIDIKPFNKIDYYKLVLCYYSVVYIPFVFLLWLFPFPENFESQLILIYFSISLVFLNFIFYSKFIFKTRVPELIFFLVVGIVLHLYSLSYFSINEIFNMPLIDRGFVWPIVQIIYLIIGIVVLNKILEFRKYRNPVINVVLVCFLHCFLPLLLLAWYPVLDHAFLPSVLLILLIGVSLLLITFSFEALEKSGPVF